MLLQVRCRSPVLSFDGASARALGGAAASLRASGRKPAARSIRRVDPSNLSSERRPSPVSSSPSPITAGAHAPIASR